MVVGVVVVSSSSYPVWWCCVVQQSQVSVEKCLSEMLEQGSRMSYDNGLLCATVTQLKTQLQSLPGLLNELHQLRESSHDADENCAKVLLARPITLVSRSPF